MNNPRNLKPSKQQLFWLVGNSYAVRSEILDKYAMSPAQLDYLAFIYSYSEQNVYFTIPCFTRTHIHSAPIAYKMNTKLVNAGYLKEFTPPRFNAVSSHAYITDNRTKKVRKRGRNGQIFIITVKGQHLLNDYFKAFQKVNYQFG